MKSRIIALAFAGSLLIGPATAADLLYAPKPQHGYVDGSGWYIGLKGGANFADDFSGIGFDTGYNAGAVVGTSLGNVGFAGARIELEGGYLSSEASVAAPFSGSLSAVYGFANGYLDFNIGLPFTPFIGAGVGFADVNAEAQVAGFPFVDSHDQTWAWNATAGVSYELHKGVDLDVAYRYLSVPDVTFNTVFGPVADDVNIHQVTGTVRFKL